jgi:hypothetical protein
MLERVSDLGGFFLHGIYLRRMKMGLPRIFSRVNTRGACAQAASPEKDLTTGRGLRKRQD